MNKVIQIGRLVRDPEIRDGQNTKVATYTLAVDRRGKKEEGQQTADFIPCKAFGTNAEFVEKFLRKGVKIAVTGRLQSGSYTNKDGQKVYTLDVIVEEHEFAESRQNSANVQEVSTATASSDGFVTVDVDEELPFK